MANPTLVEMLRERCPQPPADLVFFLERVEQLAGCWCEDRRGQAQVLALAIAFYEVWTAKPANAGEALFGVPRYSLPEAPNLQDVRRIVTNTTPPPIKPIGTQPDPANRTGSHEVEAPPI